MSYINLLSHLCLLLDNHSGNEIEKVKLNYAHYQTLIFIKDKKNSRVNKHFSQSTFCLVIVEKAQVSLLTLTMGLLLSSAPVSHDSETACTIPGSLFILIRWCFSFCVMSKCLEKGIYIYMSLKIFCVCTLSLSVIDAFQLDR